MQFGLHCDGTCEAFFTYPIPGYPWRRNVVKTGSWEIDKDLTLRIFDEVTGLPAKCPDSCLSDAELWSDHSEKANAVTRDRKTNALCYSIGVVKATGEFTVRYSMRETDVNLTQTTLLRVVSELTSELEAYKP